MQSRLAHELIELAGLADDDSFRLPRLRQSLSALARFHAECDDGPSGEALASLVTSLEKEAWVAEVREQLSVKARRSIARAIEAAIEQDAHDLRERRRA